MQTVRLTMYAAEDGELLERTIYINPEHVVKAYESKFTYRGKSGDKTTVPCVRIDTDDIIPVQVAETLPEVMAKIGGETGQTYTLCQGSTRIVYGLTHDEAEVAVRMLSSEYTSGEFHIMEER